MAVESLPPFLQRKIRFVPAISTDPIKLNAPNYTTVQKRPLLPKKYPITEWPKVLPVGVGLNNVGNTCFLNSVLQCLIYTPPLNVILLKHACKEGVCIQCEMSKLFKNMTGNAKRAVTPSGIVGRLKSIAKHFRVGRQEDAHEFLRFLLEAMQKRDASVTELFAGSLESTVKCQQCGHASKCQDPMMDLSVDIRHASSVDAAIKQFCHPERLPKSARYRCEGCKQVVEAAKQFSLHQLPACLTVHLKRFSVNLQTGYPTKINRDVSFGETINLEDATGSHSYRLYGVIVHEGSGCNVGHYHAFIRASNDLWYSMNDDQVMQVSLNTVLRQKAYLLFYRRLTGRIPDDTREPSPVPSLNSPVAAVGGEKRSASQEESSHKRPSMQDAIRLETSGARVEKSDKPIVRPSGPVPIRLIPSTPPPTSTPPAVVPEQRSTSIWKTTDTIKRVPAASPRGTWSVKRYK